MKKKNKSYVQLITAKTGKLLSAYPEEVGPLLSKLYMKVASQLGKLSYRKSFSGFRIQGFLLSIFKVKELSFYIYIYFFLLFNHSTVTI